MQVIIDNFEYIVVFFIIIFLVLAITSLIILIRVFKFFNNKKFRIYGTYDHEPLTNTKEFAIQIFNSNINDIRIVAFGFMYKEQTIDYYKTYQNLNKLDPTKQVIILSRDSIKLNISSTELETIIADYNLGKIKLSKLCAYVTDSQGKITKRKVNKIRKVIASSWLVKHKAKVKSEKEIFKQLQLEKKEEKKKQRKLNALKRKEKIQRWWLVLKTKLKIRPKNKKE